MNRKKITFTILVITIVLSVCFIYYIVKLNDTTTINSNIKNAAKTIEYLYLSDITPFDWDEAFIIEDPYIGGDALDKIVGVKCGLKRSDIDSTRRIIFIKDKKFVYDYIYRWSDITFIPLGIVIDKEHCKFEVKIDDNERIFLQHKNINRK